MKAILRGLFSFIPGVLCLTLLAGTSRADLSDAIKMAPRGANAVMTIDVAKLIASPLGTSSGLQSKLIKGYADRPLAVPATAKRVTLFAGVHPTGLEAVWQTAIIELGGDVRLERILAAQGGYADVIEGKPAVWSKRDTYYVELGTTTLGVVRPAQRQFVSRWVGGKNEAALSGYLSNALTAGSTADAVFAVDMDGVVSSPAAQYAFNMGELPSVEKLDEAVQGKVLNALGSVKGMTITMRAAEQLNAEWIIDFGSDITALSPQVKPLVLDVLTSAGLNEGGAATWDFKTEGSRIIGKGTMDLEGLSRLIALLAPGDIAAGDSDAAPKAAGGAPKADDPAPKPAAPTDAAQASLNYYRAVSKSIDAIGQKLSPTDGATWLIAQSRKIQGLPILNVDPALIDWGNQVASAYSRGAQELAIGQQNAKNAASGVQSPTPYVQYDGAGAATGLGTAGDHAAFKNAQEQRRQAAQTERAAAAGRAMNYFNQVAPMRGQIRAQMTQKYGIEF